MAYTIVIILLNYEDMRTLDYEVKAVSQLILKWLVVKSTGGGAIEG
jgi:hypothetical protein